EKLSRATSMPASTIRTSVGSSRQAGPIVATIFVRRIYRRKLLKDLAVLDDNFAVGPQTSSFAQVTDEVPVERGRVRATGVGIGAPEREVHRPRDLLVEQDRAGGAIDPGVGPDPELAEKPRAGVGEQRRLQVLI